jgi:hypothetical protein
VECVYITAIIYGLLVVLELNTLASSTNGTTWTGRGATIITTECWGVYYANGLWVAVGQGTNTIATSTNGTTWTGRGATIFTTICYDVTY